jgi:hypothetical protein
VLAVCKNTHLIWLFSTFPLLIEIYGLWLKKVPPTHLSAG